MDDAEFQRLIAKVRKSEPAETTKDIYRLIQVHREMAIETFGSYIKFFEDFFDDLNEMIAGLNFVEHRGWKPHNANQFTLFPEAMKSLHRAFEDSLDGYYDEAMMLNRSVYETALRIVFISCYPMEVEAVYYPRKGKINFDVTNFTKDHLKLDWEFLYRLMCRIAHSKMHRNLKTWIRLASGNSKEMISLTYKWDMEFMAMSVNGTLFELAFLFHIAITLFGKDLKGNSRLAAQEEHFREVDRALLAITSHNPREKFAALASDIQKIGRIITAAENGNDWKKLV